MSPFVLALVLSSTVMHAAWNLVARQQKASVPRILYRAHIVVIGLGLLPVLGAELCLGPLPGRVYAYAVGSGFFCALYYFGLAHGYRSADFSVVYPVVGAVPVLLVGVGDIVRGRFPTAAGWLGMVLVATGCLLAPRRSFREFRLRQYLHESVLWMLLAAAGTVGYTMVDKLASEAVQPGLSTALRYGYLFWLPGFVFYAALMKLVNVRPEDREPVGWWRPFLCALLNFGAYGLILWAYQMTERASYVVAFRQASIVIGVVAAFVIYQEGGKLVRTTAALLITAGLVVIALLGG